MNVPDKKGKIADVILGYDNLEGYLSNNPHFGAIIGRNANRIGGAVITIDGKDYKLEANNGRNKSSSVLRISITDAFGTVRPQKPTREAALLFL